jgi:Holliday junction resolvase RusA-like endonuclease
MKKLPTVTSQEKGIDSRGGVRVYTKDEIRAAKLLFIGLLSKHAPPKPLTGAVRLTTKWCYLTRVHRDGEYKITRPDTDNTVKLFKDCMTATGFWKDDAQVASEITEKFWVRESPSGIYVKVEELP